MRSFSLGTSTVIRSVLTTAARRRADRTRLWLVLSAVAASFVLTGGQARAQFHAVETILHSFDDGTVPDDGKNPGGSLIQASDGSFYGTTEYGGTAADSNSGNGAGTVFKITPGGTYTVLHNFDDGSVANDGHVPTEALVQGSDGNFYGTTQSGGPYVSADPNGLGFGTVFKMTPAGTVTILHDFGGPAAGDGSYPSGPLIQGPDGTLYGVTEQGGSGPYPPYSSLGSGTVYAITPSGTYTLLHSFSTGSSDDGIYPIGTLVFGSDGNLYGTTEEGGTTAMPARGIQGNGVAYKITPAGAVTVLHNFRDGSVANDGANPFDGLVLGRDGNFYGTTYDGGSTTVPNAEFSGYGVAFRMTPAGQITILHNFGDSSVANDAIDPETLLQGSDGNFYGTSVRGGSANDGAAFSVTPTGAVTILHSFGDGSVANDGSDPNGLVQAADGNFYGTTYSGGAGILTDPDKNGYGTVYELSVPLGGPPPVLTSFTPASGPPGTVVTITGQSLGEFSAVRFGTVKAAVASVNAAGTQITATVPAGALTGPISVTTPGGTGQSATRFTVTPLPAPTLSPTSGPIGTVVTITSTNLGDTSAVRFHNANATSFSVNSAGTQITAVVPTGALSGTVQITTPYGSVQTITHFTVTAPAAPSVSSFSPASGFTGTSVVLTGPGIGAATSVAFGGIPATYTVNSPTQVTAVVPGTVPNGPASITVTNSDGTTTSATGFAVTGGAPVPVTISPASGPVGTVVTITGQRLDGVTVVRFHDADATVSSASADGTVITATVPNGALSGTLKITTPLGTTQTTASFTVTP